MTRAMMRSLSSFACSSASAAFSPWFFHRLMVHCHCRAVARSTVAPQSFRMLVTSSLSRIENWGLSPSTAPSWRIMRTPSA